MSTETNANPNAANAAPTTSSPPVAPATAQPPAKPKFEVDYDPNNPPWLNDRLERERKAAAKDADANARKALLEELGGDPDSIKKLLAEEKKRAEERKTLEQRVAERDATLKAKEDRNKELEESVKSYAEGQLAGLTEQQKAAVIAVAGNDPPKQLKAIEALRPTWTIVSNAQQSQSTTQQTQGSQSANGSAATNPNTQMSQTTSATQAKFANATAPGPNAPPPAGSSVVPNHLEIYERLSNQSSPDYKPFAAANYLLAYGKEIEAARKSRGSN